MAENQFIKDEILERYGIKLAIKREDLLHPVISGNKYRKLKYNIAAAKKDGQTTLLTFGGAYSNHILATAQAAKENGLKSIGVIRGEELETKPRNPTLTKAEELGMQLFFVTRAWYRERSTETFHENLVTRFGRFYLLPEGGTNQLAIKGCGEILTEHDRAFDYICCSVGTGGTLAGLINSSDPAQEVLGFAALRGSFLQNEIAGFTPRKNWKLIEGYTFGGYAKVTKELVHFINDYRARFNVPLDPIYTGKMMFGVRELIKIGYFRPASKILAIHTGGLQGIHGANAKLRLKNLPLITV